MDLAHAVAIVTGGGTGIGKAISTQLAAAGIPIAFPSMTVEMARP